MAPNRRVRIFGAPLEQSEALAGKGSVFFPEHDSEQRAKTANWTRPQMVALKNGPTAALLVGYVSI
jgi:hypothetical protein